MTLQLNTPRFGQLVLAHTAKQTSLNFLPATAPEAADQLRIGDQVIRHAVVKELHDAFTAGNMPKAQALLKAEAIQTQLLDALKVSLKAQSQSVVEQATELLNRFFEKSADWVTRYSRYEHFRQAGNGEPTHKRQESASIIAPDHPDQAELTAYPKLWFAPPNFIAPEPSSGLPHFTMPQGFRLVLPGFLWTAPAPTAMQPKHCPNCPR